MSTPESIKPGPKKDNVKEATMPDNDDEVPGPPLYNRVFCPAQPGDDEKAALACESAMASFAGVLRPLATGDNKQLRTLDPRTTLYFVSHGGGTRPLFRIGAQTWDAIAMANLLETAGLPKKHRQVVMLVCYAGNSVGTREEVARTEQMHRQRDKLAASAEKAKDRANYSRYGQLQGEHQEVDKRIKAHSDAAIPGYFGVFEGDHVPAESGTALSVLPLVAQLINELKRRGYSYIRLRAFTGKVKVDFSNGIMVASHVIDDAGAMIEITCPEAPANTVNWF